jgi:hypothetical protein
VTDVRQDTGWSSKDDSAAYQTGASVKLWSGANERETRIVDREARVLLRELRTLDVSRSSMV